MTLEENQLKKIPGYQYSLKENSFIKIFNYYF